jgi:hypothetical protein
MVCSDRDSSRGQFGLFEVVRSGALLKKIRVYKDKPGGRDEGFPVRSKVLVIFIFPSFSSAATASNSRDRERLPLPLHKAVLQVAGQYRLQYRLRYQPATHTASDCAINQPRTPLPASPAPIAAHSTSSSSLLTLGLHHPPPSQQKARKGEGRV